MKVVITSATEKEISGLKTTWSKSRRQFHNLEIDFHISGVGLLSSCFSISQLLQNNKPDMVIQMGIAGSFIETWQPDELMLIKSDFVGDSGVWENEGFNDLADLHLIEKNQFPFILGKLENPYTAEYNLLSLPEVTSCTVNEITTNKKMIDFFISKHHCTLESMEGASLHYCCLQYNIPFLQLRAVSNSVGDRNKTNWKLQEAFQTISSRGYQFLESLNKFV